MTMRSDFFSLFPPPPPFFPALDVVVVAAAEEEEEEEEAACGPATGRFGLFWRGGGPGRSGAAPLVGELFLPAPPSDDAGGFGANDSFDWENDPPAFFAVAVADDAASGTEGLESDRIIEVAAVVVVVVVVDVAPFAGPPFRVGFDDEDDGADCGCAAAGGEGF